MLHYKRTTNKRKQAKKKITHNSKITQHCSRARKKNWFRSFFSSSSSKNASWHLSSFTHSPSHSISIVCWTPSMWWSLRKCWMKWFVACSHIWQPTDQLHWELKRKEKVECERDRKCLFLYFCSSFFGVVLFTSVNKVQFVINGTNDNRQEQASEKRIKLWQACN